MYELPKTNINYSHTAAIAIPIKSKFEQYGLLHTRFDPPQNSPPSVWKMRLNKRVGSVSNSMSPKQTRKTNV